MEHLLRVATLVVAAVMAVGATLVGPVQHRVMALRAHPAANVVSANVTQLRWSVPIEANGRVELVDNRRLVAKEAADAAAAKAAAARAKARANPTPAPATSIPSYPAGTVQDIITKAFTPYGTTAVAWGLRVAKCESGYNPRAYNAAGPYYGLFQFLMSTFKATPYGGQEIYDPVANASAAAWKYGQGGAGAWGCK